MKRFNKRTTYDIIKDMRGILSSKKSMYRKGKSMKRPKTKQAASSHTPIFLAMSEISTAPSSKAEELFRNRWKKPIDDFKAKEAYMNLERVKRIKEEIKKTVKSKKRSLPSHKEVEKEIEQQANDWCDKIIESKNAAQIEDIIQKKLLNDPVLAYAKQRKSSEQEMKKKWNELVYVVKKKQLLLESLEVQKVGLDKVLKRYAKRKSNLDFLQG